MERLEYEFQTSKSIQEPHHIGVVGSGDLEIIFEPTKDSVTKVSVLTGSDGFATVWENVLTRFFDRYPIHANITVRDFGATPGVVSLRFAQAMEVLKYVE